MICTASGIAAAGQYANIGSVTGVDPFGTRVNDSDPVALLRCRPGIDIEKATNGDDADHPPGAVHPGRRRRRPGPTSSPTPATVALTGIAVDRRSGVVVTCPATTLAIGASMTCTGAGGAAGGPVREHRDRDRHRQRRSPSQDSDASHYFGEDAVGRHREAVNGVDADVPTGPLVSVGDAVGWTLRGDQHRQRPAALERHRRPGRRARVPAPAASSSRASRSPASAGGLGDAGQYTNIGTVPGHAALGPGRHRHRSRELLRRPGRDRARRSSPTAIDADVAPGPFIAVGAPVTWTYRVTNTGNGALTNVAVRDLAASRVTCPATTLAAGASMTCTGAGPPRPASTPTAPGDRRRTVTGKRVRDFDPSNYYGAAPGHPHREEHQRRRRRRGARSGHPRRRAGGVDLHGLQHRQRGLTAIAVTDDRGVTGRVPRRRSPRARRWSARRPGTATLGQYENTATVGRHRSDRRAAARQRPVALLRRRVRDRRARSTPTARTPTPRRVRRSRSAAPVTWTYVVTQHGQHADPAGRPGRRPRRRAVRSSAATPTPTGDSTRARRGRTRRRASRWRGSTRTPRRSRGSTRSRTRSATATRRTTSASSPVPVSLAAPLPRRTPRPPCRPSRCSKTRRALARAGGNDGAVHAARAQHGHGHGAAGARVRPAARPGSPTLGRGREDQGRAGVLHQDDAAARQTRTFAVVDPRRARHRGRGGSATRRCARRSGLMRAAQCARDRVLPALAADRAGSRGEAGACATALAVALLAAAPPAAAGAARRRPRDGRSGRRAGARADPRRGLGRARRRARARLRAGRRPRGGRTPRGVRALGGRPEPAARARRPHRRRGRRWLRVRLPQPPQRRRRLGRCRTAPSSRAPDGGSRSTSARGACRAARAAACVHSFPAGRRRPRDADAARAFAVAEIVRQADPDGFLGPWALHLTAHSDVLDNYGGGPGTVAHPRTRRGVSLLDPLGTRRIPRLHPDRQRADPLPRAQARPGHAGHDPVVISRSRAGRTGRASGRRRG